MKIVAIVGSYRKGGTIDTVVDEILLSLREEGAEISKIYLIDKHIEFCTNCRVCTQDEGHRRGKCVIEDDMVAILEEIENADALVFGSPMNFGTVTAVTKKFIERLVCFSYWPWGADAPKIRSNDKGIPAIVVASSAAPSLIARLSGNLVKLLREAAGLLGARTIGTLFIGLAAKDEHHDIGRKAREKARRLGKKLASAIRAR